MQCMIATTELKIPKGLHRVREHGTVNNFISFAGNERKCQEMRIKCQESRDQTVKDHECDAKELEWFLSDEEGILKILSLEMIQSKLHFR